MTLSNNSNDEESLEDQDESGWKYIHGDVFRFPKKKSLLSTVVGSGTQLFALTIFIFLLALVGVFYPYNRGALFTALVIIYALTSGIAGYTVTSLYRQLEGTNWVKNLLMTECLFCGPLFLTFCFLNNVAIVYSATAALPFGTILVILLICALVTYPLLVLGGIAGKNIKTEFQAPWGFDIERGVWDGRKATAALASARDSLPPRKGHRRSRSEIPFAFLPSSLPLQPAAAAPAEDVFLDSAKMTTGVENYWDRELDVDGVTSDDLFAAYMNLDGFDGLNFSEENHEDLNS
ncbi:hypothetical protein Cni_G01902 [Canna indica]|uniref:Transmembrane 9 superfamily member n=1 Tax=Canna indica TaxID=4628 RepID=A0AAQ3JQ16_9LILI|nr:hypothetical protein Cni_G01902 [Canna indica]